MRPDIEVVNVKGLHGAQRNGIEYVGRNFAGWAKSPLANRYKITESRDDVIALYRKWLWAEYQKRGMVYAEIDRLARRAANGERVKIGCWCWPDPCHGDIVKSCLIYHIGQVTE